MGCVYGTFSIATGLHRDFSCLNETFHTSDIATQETPNIDTSRMDSHRVDLSFLISLPYLHLLDATRKGRSGEPLFGHDTSLLWSQLSHWAVIVDGDTHTGRHWGPIFFLLSSPYFLLTAMGAQSLLCGSVPPAPASLSMGRAREPLEPDATRSFGWLRYTPLSNDRIVRLRYTTVMLRYTAVMLRYTDELKGHAGSNSQLPTGIAAAPCLPAGVVRPCRRCGGHGR